MKKIFLPILSLLIAFTANAQNILTPIDTVINGKPSDFDIIIDGDFENKGDSGEFIWVSTNVSISNGWGVAICDNNQCYDTNVRSQVMFVNKGAKANFDVHAYPYGNVGSAVTKVVIYRKSDMNDSVVNTYTFNAEPQSNVKKVKLTSFEVYPNPSRDELNINFESSKSIEMKIFNVLGVEVMNHYHITSDSKVNVSQLQPGIYFIKFVDANGKAYVKSFKKSN